MGHPALSVRRSVGPSVRRSVGPSHFTFSAFMGFLAIPLLPKCSTDLEYGPCPPARDWGSRVSGLVFISLVFFPLKVYSTFSLFFQCYFFSLLKVYSPFSLIISHFFSPL